MRKPIKDCLVDKTGLSDYKADQRLIPEEEIFPDNPHVVWCIRGSMERGNGSKIRYLFS
jgi:hypothetical protein